MTQSPTWLVYATAFAAIFSGIFVSAAGLYFTYRQWRFAKDQPKRDLEAHRRALKAAKHERLIADFAVILRHSMAQKEYIRLQNVVIQGKDSEEQEKQRLDYLYAESEGLNLAMMKVRLEGVGKEIHKIGNEQFIATDKVVKLQKLLFERIDKQDGSNLTYLNNSINEARALAIQKCDELEAVLKKKLEELENPEAL